jgi:hypothetical protein
MKNMKKKKKDEKGYKNKNDQSTIRINDHTFFWWFGCRSRVFPENEQD